MNNITTSLYTGCIQQRDLLEAKYVLSTIDLLGIENNCADAYRAMEAAIKAEIAKEELLYPVTIDSYVVDERSGWDRAFSTHRKALSWVTRCLSKGKELA